MKKLLFLANLFLYINFLQAGAGFGDTVMNQPLNSQEKSFLNALSNAPSAFLTRPPSELLQGLRGAGIDITPAQVDKIRQEFQKIINLRSTANMTYVSLANVKSVFPYLSNAQAEKLYHELQDGMYTGNLDPGDRVFASLFFIVTGIQLFSKELLIQMQTKAVVEPSAPSSPTMTLTKNTMGGVMNNMVNNFNMKTSGGLSLSNQYLSYDYSYQEYEFTDTDDAGHVHYNSLTYGANLTEDFAFAFSFFQDQTDQRGTNDLFSNQLGANLAFTFNLTENYSIGAYGFYSEADIEEINDHTWTYGGGLLFATYHQFGDFSISSVNTILKSYTNFSHDTLYIAMLRLGYQWTDSFSSSVYSYYIDSIREPVEGLDTSYMIFGADLSYQLTENINISIGAETVEFLKEYRSETLFFSLRYDF